MFCQQVHVCSFTTVTNQCSFTQINVFFERRKFLFIRNQVSGKLHILINSCKENSSSTVADPATGTIWAAKLQLYKTLCGDFVDGQPAPSRTDASLLNGSMYTLMLESAYGPDCLFLPAQGLQTMNLAQSIDLRNPKLSLYKPNQTSPTASYFAQNTVISEGWWLYLACFPTLLKPCTILITTACSTCLVYLLFANMLGNK